MKLCIKPINNMKCFYHCDMDGEGAARCVALYTNNFNKNNYISVNYNNSIPEAKLVDDNDTVFIVDYSFTQNTVHNLFEIADKAKEVYWIDHHKSSFDDFPLFNKELNNYKNIIFTLNDKESGAKIAFNKLILPNALEETDDLRLFNKLINYIDDYDRWIHKYKESLLLNVACSTIDTSPTSIFWTDILSDEKMNELINFGALLHESNTSKANSLCKSKGYEITINNHKCLVLNTTAGSISFGDRYKDYIFGIRYLFDGEKFEYSVYSSLEDIDCSIIAKYFDKSGGGHKGAAGFRSDTILFKKDDQFTIPMG